MLLIMSTRDALNKQQKQARQRFATAQRLEKEYMRTLRLLTRQIDHIVKGMAPNGRVKDSTELQLVLRNYANTIKPWARSVAEKMIARIAQKDEFAWMQLGKEMGMAMRKELAGAPTGEMLREFLEEQVRLITSLPLDAAERVHKLTTEGLIAGGARSNEIAKEILKTGAVTESRAKLIARTEIARTASGLTMARAKFVGSTHYIWRTSGDGDVRPSHKKMNGQIVAWDSPPEVDPGHNYHAGMFPNCRCYPEPIITKD